MLNSNAYWILSDSSIIDIGLETHIAYIIFHPVIFQTTKEQIISIYKEYDELLGIEGMARREIIMGLIDQGYIRVRQYKTHWSISLKQWEQSQFLLSKWADIAINIKNAGKYMPVIITTLKGSKFNLIVDNLHSPTV